MNLILERKLRADSEEKYADFTAKLIPTVPRESILGVRIPILRQIAKDMVKSDNFKEFLAEKHTFLEEKLLHGFILGYVKYSPYELVKELEVFIPTIDNWSVCDSTVSGLKIIKNNTEIFFEKCKYWLNSKSTFTVRFAIIVLLDYFLDDAFSPEINDILARIITDEYYVNMALAWYFSTALVKQFDATISYFIEGKIANPWVHNKSIQKVRESYRIPPDTKSFLKTLTKKTKM